MVEKKCSNTSHTEQDYRPRVLGEKGGRGVWIKQGGSNGERKRRRILDSEDYYLCGHVPCMGYTRKCIWILVGKPEIGCMEDET